MQRALARNIEIGFEWMARERMRRLISGRNLVPVQTNSRDLNLFDIYEERVACQTMADSGVEECDDPEDEREYHSNNPRNRVPREIAER